MQNMETVTINVQDDIIREFRELAADTFGSGKGHLGKAFTEAIEKWMYDRKQKKIAEEAIDMMEHGFNMGKRLYKDRGELHER